MKPARFAKSSRIMQRERPRLLVTERRWGRSTGPRADADPGIPVPAYLTAWRGLGQGALAAVVPSPVVSDSSRNRLPVAPRDANGLNRFQRSTGSLAAPASA